MTLSRGRISDNIFITTLDRLVKWSRQSSLWPLHLELACCSIEIKASAARFDLDRLGAGVFVSSPIQADVMIVAGTVTLKMATHLFRLYNEMARPKYVISMGNCAISGGPYWQHGYHVLKGIDQILPVDIYIPGCPPRPETLIEGIRALQEKIGRE